MTTDAIKTWLRTHGHSREWLGLKCGVSKSTVNGWLSAGRPIPRSAADIIRSLMEDGATVQPRFTIDQVTRMQAQAKKEGKTLDEWVAEAVLARLSKLGLLLALMLTPIFLLSHLFSNHTNTAAGWMLTAESLFQAVRGFVS